MGADNDTWVLIAVNKIAHPRTSWEYPTDSSCFWRIYTLIRVIIALGSLQTSFSWYSSAFSGTSTTPCCSRWPDWLAQQVPPSRILFPEFKDMGSRSPKIPIRPCPDQPCVLFSVPISKIAAYLYLAAMLYLIRTRLYTAINEWNVAVGDTCPKRRSNRLLIRIWSGQHPATVHQ